MTDSHKNTSPVTTKPPSSSLNGPWKLAKSKAEKPEKESDEWPSLGTSMKTEKPVPAKPRERHSTGNSVDEKNSKLKWEKVSFNITYKSKEHGNHKNESSDYDKENDGNSRNKKSRSFIKHTRGNRGYHNNSSDQQEPGNHYRGNRYRNSYQHNNYHKGQGQMVGYPGVPNAQLISRLPVGIPYLMLYPAVSKKNNPNNGQDTPAVPPACICILPPGTDHQQASLFLIRQQVQRQIEFYFTPENLTHDRYLRGNMNEEGWVPISLIANFNRVATLTQNISEIVEAVKQSNFLDFDEKSTSVRTKNNPQFWVPNQSDGNDIKVDNLISLILNYLVVLIPANFLKDNSDKNQSKTLSSTEINILSTALNKFSHDARILQRPLVDYRYLGLTLPPTSPSYPLYTLHDSASSEKSNIAESVSNNSDSSMTTNPNAFYHHQQQMHASNLMDLQSTYHSTITPEMHSALLQQEWMRQQYLIGSNYQVPKFNPTNLQTLPLAVEGSNNGIHAIPVIYMQSDGSISYFDQNQTSLTVPKPNKSAPSPSEQAKKNPSLSELTRDNTSSIGEGMKALSALSPFENEDNVLPFFQFIRNLPSYYNIKHLASFHNPSQPDENLSSKPFYDNLPSRVPHLKIPSILPDERRTFGFLFNSLPNQILPVSSGKEDSNLISNMPEVNHLTTLQNHPIKDLLKMNQIVTYSYEEFEKLCCSKESKLDFESLCEFWCFLLQRNPTKEFIAIYRRLLAKNSSLFSSPETSQHYSRILFNFYVELPSYIIIDLHKVIFADIEAYLEKFDPSLMAPYNVIKEQFYLKSETSLKLSVLLKLLHLDFE